MSSKNARARTPGSRCASLGVLLMLSAASTLAASRPAEPTQVPAAPPVLDAAAVESFVDSVMAEALPKTYAPGVVVTIVEGNRLVLAKGYGVADLETRAPIDPAHTLFRIASITKLFTTVAALRLEEQGKLDLDADVNRYLTRVKVPATFPEPVTVRRLMTHHGGLDTAVGYMDFPNERAAVRTPKQMSWDILRARPVTAMPIYDNMGFGLLGLVVADAVGQSYAQVVQQEIFNPLGMDQSVVGLPQNRVADAAHPYMRGPNWQAMPISHNLMPTSAQGGGDISATAVDMGKFLSAMLVPGSLLKPATLARMTNFDTERFHPQIPGLGLALWQYDYRGHMAEGHRGEINGFISRIAWFRDPGIGVFISVNSTVQRWPQPRLSYVLTHGDTPAPPAGARTLDPDPLIDGFLGRFADRFLPAPPPPPKPTPPAANEPQGEQLAGAYFRLDATTHLMARMLASLHAVHFEPLADRQFAVEGMCRPFVHKGPLYYECRPPGGEPIAVGFRVVDGSVFAGIGPVGSQERQPWWRTAPFALWPIPILALLGLSALIARPRAQGPARRRVLGLAGLGATLYVLALLLELQFGYDLAHSPLHELRILWRVLFPLAAVLLLASAALTVPALRTASRAAAPLSAISASYHVVLALASVGLVWLICIWGLAWPFH
jgi:CubicO group peptidase (beta-lactamase class C family)